MVTLDCCVLKDGKNAFSSLLFSVILFAKLYETKELFPIRNKPSDNSNSNSINDVSHDDYNASRRNIRLLTRDLTSSRDSIALDRYVRETDRKYVDQIRSKRKKREFIRLPLTNRRVVRLQSKTGFFLEILPSGKVCGHINKTKFTKLELQVISPHVKRIKGVATGKYLAINHKGKVISKDVSDNETYFYEEVLENMQHLYSSIKYPKLNSGLSWYVGLKRKNGNNRFQGRTKRASRTLPGDAATHFSIFFDENVKQFS